MVPTVGIRASAVVTHPEVTEASGVAETVSPTTQSPEVKRTASGCPDGQLFPDRRSRPDWFGRCPPSGLESSDPRSTQS